MSTHASETGVVSQDSICQVNRSELTPMSIVFEDLLSLQDPVEHVRSLLRAFPDEIAEYLADTTVDNEGWLRVLHVVRLADQYDCLGLVHWAFDAIVQDCRNQDAMGITTLVTAIIQLYPLREHLPGLDEWVETFLQRSWASLELDDLRLLRAAAAAQWPSLERSIYYGLVRKTASHWSKLALTPQEKFRLLSGYHNLSVVLLNLPNLTFTIKHSSCSPDHDEDSCEANWRFLWSECCIRTSHPFLEIRPKLDGIKMALDSLGDGKAPVSNPVDPVIQQVLLPQCWKEYRRATTKLFKQVNTITQTCFDGSIGFASPALEALWFPTGTSDS